MLKPIATLFITASFFIVSPALASPAKHIADQQFQVKSTLNSLGFGVKNERIQKSKHGRSDLSMKANKSRTHIVNTFKQAYRTDRQLPNGYRVTGWASQANGTFSVTLVNPKAERITAIIGTNESSPSITIRGRLRKENFMPVRGKQVKPTYDALM